jgi:hypothetical protein
MLLVPLFNALKALVGAEPDSRNQQATSRFDGIGADRGPQCEGSFLRL